MYPSRLRATPIPSPLWSRAFGVAQPAISASVLLALSVFPSSLYCSVAGVHACGVGQPASVAACPSVRPNPFPFACFFLDAIRRTLHVESLSTCSPEVVVGHAVETLSDMRRAFARSAQIGRRAGVTRTFQVREYSV